MSGDLMQQVWHLATELVGNWQYFVDGCLGGIFLELAVLGGLSRVNRANITNKVALTLYTACCIVGGGIYAARFLSASSDYAAMVEGFTFPITLGSIAGRVPERPGHNGSDAQGERRQKARRTLRQRLEDL
jgi:hypothetical protein